jgi:hypothetical protein
MYRSCRAPQGQETAEAEFKGNNVKLFMQAPSIDGNGAKYSETYYLQRVFDATDVSLVMEKILGSPDTLKQFLANNKASKQSPAHEAALAYNQAHGIVSSTDAEKETREGRASLLLIVSEPTGAQVYLDDKLETTTPNGLYLVKHDDAPRKITIKKDGFQTFEQEYRPDGTEFSIDLKMDPVAATK